MSTFVSNGTLTTMPAFADLRIVFGMNASDSTALMGKLRGLKAKHRQTTVSQSPLPLYGASEASLTSVGSSTLINTSVADAGSCSRADSAVCLASTRNSLETKDDLKKHRDDDAPFATANRRSRKISKPRGHPHRKAIFVDALLAAEEQGTSLPDGDEDAGSGVTGAQDDDSISVASTIHDGLASGVGSRVDLDSSTEMLVTLEGFPCDTRSASLSLPASERLDIDKSSAPRRLRNLLRKALAFPLRPRPGRSRARQSAPSSFDPVFMARLRPASAIEYTFKTLPIYCSTTGERVEHPGRAWVGETTAEMVDRVSRDLGSGRLVVESRLELKSVVSVLERIVGSLS